MGHNISRQRLDALRMAQRVADLSEFVIPGWRIDARANQLVSIDTVLGSHQRGEVLLFRCKMDECRRRVEPNLRRAIEAGLGDRTCRELGEKLQCRHWRGCRLDLEARTYSRGVPLVGYVTQDMLIAIGCAKCRRRSLLPATEVIRRLKAAGTGGGHTGVLELHQKVRGPCRKCGGRTFKVELISLMTPR